MKRILIKLPAARTIASKTQDYDGELGNKVSVALQMDRQWEVVQYDATTMMLMRMPAVWTIASKT